jgi:hypothetical protein
VFKDCTQLRFFPVILDMRFLGKQCFIFFRVYLVLAQSFMAREKDEITFVQKG